MDKDVLSKAKTDEHALELILNEYAPIVRGISRRYFLFGGEQEDLIQEGMVGLYQAIMSFDEKNGTSFKTYAINCIDNKIKTAIKQANRQKNLALNQYTTILDELDDDEEGYIVISEGMSPEESYFRRQRNRLIVQRLKEELSLEERKILSQYLQGAKYIDIAKEMNKSVKYIDNKLFRIKKILSKLKDNISG